LRARIAATVAEPVVENTRAEQQTLLVAGITGIVHHAAANQIGDQQDGDNDGKPLHVGASLKAVSGVEAVSQKTLHRAR
jgi:hypothetical protein